MPEPIKCPECGGPCEADHNSFSCRGCKRCWPKGHGWESEWDRKASQAAYTKIRRGKGDPPKPLEWNSTVVKMQGCPDCGGRGYFLINPFATGGGDGCGGVRNTTQCLTCQDSEAYFKQHGELPPEIAERVMATMQSTANG